MLRLSESMQFVFLRAKAEGDYMHRDPTGIEFLFLGILKLSELKAEAVFNLPKKDLDRIDVDIAQVREALSARGIDSGALRGRLRHELKHGAPSDAQSGDTYLQQATELAEERGEKMIWASDMLAAILKKPSSTLREYLPDEPEQEKPKPDGEDIPYDGSEADETPDEMSPDYLPVLTSRIRRLRAKLLSTVEGQDHVVHAFVEGIFAAELLAAGDTKRVRPKAIFAFVGPPGVGKTFLAEQAAAEMDLPYMRFNMSTYSDHQSYMGLIGFEKSYQGAREGLLTGFVKKNPRCILLFDEIEKAHLNTVQLFLQVLDAGVLADRYLGTDISFKDAIIIFTSNAGKALYEGEARQNAAGVSRRVLLNALASEKDQRTGQPFFPAAITSRLATGWPLLFNHLEPHNLEKICDREFGRMCSVFEAQYSLPVKFDPMLAAALLFREGGAVDARTLRAQTELFFKSEVFKLCRLWGEDNLATAVKEWKGMSFTVETDSMPSDVRALFFNQERPEILLCGDASFAARCEEKLPGYIFHWADSTDQALEIAGEKDIRIVLLDIANSGTVSPSLQMTVQEDFNQEDLLMSGKGFDFLPMAVSFLHGGTGLLRALRERLPELPVYLLEQPEFPLDGELTMSLVHAGARGKLSVPTDDFSVLEDELNRICRELWMQGTAARMAAERKALFFETAPKLSDDRSEVTVRLRDFSLKRTADAEDRDSVLDEVEKPNVHFDDVIGCRDAKDELRFFIDYLKNPKKFSARGLKPPKGVLLYGPPGTGKTMLAKAMAGESDVAFIPAVASAFVTKWQGSGPESVRNLFQKARRYAPAIVFIDEIDAIGRKRGDQGGGHGEEMALNALLTEMDGFSVDPKRPVFVLAATNFDVQEKQGGMGVLDPALVRRFDRQVLVDLPDAEDREQLLRMLLGKSRNGTISDGMLHRLAERAVGMSPASLTSVVELANRMAVKAGKDLDDALLEEAFELTKHGEKKDWGYEYLERVARHESGHALLCWLGGKTPSYLTIVARGSHGGYMEDTSGESNPLSTRKELINRIRTSLGGRAAAIVYYGEEDGVSTGASGDLEQATKVAAAMLCAYGMDENFGLAAMDLREALQDSAMRSRINSILGEEMRNTVEIIRKNKPRIDRLVKALLKKNKLTQEEIDQLLKD